MEMLGLRQEEGLARGKEAAPGVQRGESKGDPDWVKSRIRFDRGSRGYGGFECQRRVGLERQHLG